MADFPDPQILLLDMFLEITDLIRGAGLVWFVEIDEHGDLLSSSSIFDDVLILVRGFQGQVLVQLCLEL